MSKTITLFILFSCLMTFAQAQVSGQNGYTKPSSIYNTWDFGSSLGLTFPRTDISGKGGQFGISFDATRFLSHTFALQARLIHANIAGQDINRPDYQFNSTINYDFTINAILQSKSLIILPPSLRDRIALYVSVGAGIVHYSPDIWLDGGYFRMHGIYSQYSQPFDTFDYRGGTDFMLPVCVGGKYRINDRISISAEYSYRISNTDKLDGFFKLLSNNDSYSFYNAGIVVHLGNKSKVLEWEDPLDKLYNDVDSLKAKLEFNKRDTDGDGVPDLYDKEPSTPAGTRVYGDGTSVDTDGDGVPDYSDEEPFTNKNVKVDSKGREIRPVPPPEPVVPTPVPQTDTSALNSNELPSLFFENNSSRIDNQNYEPLSKIAFKIKSDKSITYRVISICDDATKINLIEISNRRAEAVKNYLVKYYNINPDKLITEVQFVPQDPASVDKNRRVEVRARR